MSDRASAPTSLNQLTMVLSLSVFERPLAEINAVSKCSGAGSFDALSSTVSSLPLTVSESGSLDRTNFSCSPMISSTSRKFRYAPSAICCPLSIGRSSNITMRARPPSCTALSMRVTGILLRVRWTAADRPAHPPPMMVTGERSGGMMFQVILVAPVFPSRCFPCNPQFG